MRTLLFVSFIAFAAVRSAADADGLSTPDKIAARRIYVAKCAKCHRFYEPNGYADADWRSWMEKMNRKARLKPEQASLLNRYLDAYRAGKLTGKPNARP